MPSTSVTLPATFLHPLARDTARHVRGCYALQVEADKNGNPLRVQNQYHTWNALTLHASGGEVHPGLFLNKFCPDARLVKKHKRVFFAGWKQAADGRPKGYAEALLARREALVSAAASARSLRASVAWRLAIGLGNPNPLETSLSLHPQYGVPVIPSSAVKGLARHGRLMQIGADVGVFPLPIDQWKACQDKNIPTPLELLDELLSLPAADETRVQLLQKLQTNAFVTHTLSGGSFGHPITKMALADFTQQYSTTFREAFGTGNSQGKVVFLDALPLPNWQYQVDVMTPHFKEYYGDKSNTVAPADWLAPNPIFFLTVSQNSQFRFDITGQNDPLLDTVKAWITAALTNYGMGAKTASGYGQLF